MNPVIEDIKDVLVADGLGTFAGTSGWGIFKGIEPKKSVNRTTVTLIGIGGLAPEHVSDSTVNELFKSMFQVRVRAGSDADAYVEFMAVRNALVKRGKFIQNSTEYQVIRQEGDTIQQNDGESWWYFASFMATRKDTAWIPPAGCAGWWSANKSGDIVVVGEWKDQSVNVNHGTLNADAYVEGDEADKGLVLDGTGDFLDLEDAPAFLGQEDGMLTMWVQLSSLVTQQVLLQVINESGQPSGSPARNNWSLEFYYGDETGHRGKLLVTKTVDDDIYTVWEHVKITDNDWHWIAVELPGATTNCKVFVDNLEGGAYATADEGHPQGFTDTQTGLDEVSVGRFHDAALTGRYLSGRVDEVMLFNRVLTTTERASVYGNTFAKS